MTSWQYWVLLSTRVRQILLTLRIVVRVAMSMDSRMRALISFGIVPSGPREADGEDEVK